MKYFRNIGSSVVATTLGLAVLAAGRAHAQTFLFEHAGDALADRFGWAAASVGDVDADGHDDLAVGAPRSNVGGSNAGMVRVYSGRTLQVLFNWYGNAPQVRFGSSIAGAGDIDLDGHADVIVGASAWSSQAPINPQAGPGYVTVFSGATGLVLYTLIGPTFAGFGHSVASAGNIDGDGIPDFLVGSPHETVTGIGTRAGRLHVYSGATGALIRSHPGTVAYNTMGFSACFLDDLDGDGFTEYIAGEPAAWSICCGWASVRVYDGATGTELWFDDTFGFSDEPGWSVARLRDITGDGIDDVLIGAPQDPGIGCACNGKGFVRAYDAVNGAQIYQVNGTGFYSGLGWSLATIGDLNGNGFEDFAVSQPSTEDCGGSTQSVLIREGLDGSAILSIPVIGGAGAGSMFGFSLAFGDANGDGLRDLICGAPCTSINGTNSGSIRLYSIVRATIAYCESEANSLGCTPAITGIGSASATIASAFDVHATNVLNNKSGLCFYSFKPRQTPFQGGHMCVVSPTQRTPVQTSGGSAAPTHDCSGVFSLDFNARIQSGVDPLLIAGEEVFAQYWSRDPTDQSTTNLTDALAFYINP